MKIIYGDNIYYIENEFDVYMPNNETVVDVSLDDIKNGWLTVHETFSCKKCHKPITAKYRFKIPMKCINYGVYDECVCYSCTHPQDHLFSLTQVIA